MVRLRLLSRPGEYPRLDGMRELTRTALVNRSPELLFRLVNDVESYPQFVPGCSRAEVLGRSEREVTVRLGVRRGPLHTEFVTRNELDPPRELRMHLVSGPLKTLEGVWRFTPVAQNGCRVDLQLKFQFASAVKSVLLDPLMEELAGAMVRAFVARARSIDE